MKCPCCNGEGGYTEIVLDDGTGPYYPCGFCNERCTVSIIDRFIWWWDCEVNEWFNLTVRRIKKMEPAEIFFVLALLIPLIPMAIAGQWWLFGVFAAFYVVFGLMEWWSVSRDKKSISQKFWSFSETNKPMAIVILSTMAVMWVALLIHLAAKLF
jgi:hypothetical protein